jgi:NAD(P)-dependent dehydrogenase (short-subunit alcohol dehydrogenase family)
VTTSSIDRIADRVIVLTGAANGFGKLVAEQAAERGASVVGLDINEEALEAVFAPLAAQGYNVAWKKADVSILEDMQAGAALAIEKFGRIDVMINNAGIMPLAFFADHEKAASAWDRAIDINIKALFTEFLLCTNR